MFISKLIIGIFFLVFLNGCVQVVAFLGPAATFVNTGSIYQAGLSYGSDRIVTSFTGKSTGQNIKDMLEPKKNENKIISSAKERIKSVSKIDDLSSQ